MRTSDFWPNPEQKFLVKGAPADGEGALRAWGEISTGVTQRQWHVDYVVDYVKVGRGAKARKRRRP